MTQTELLNYSAYIITEYYRNNIQPFLNSFSSKCLWIGPAEGQIIRTKKALLSTFAKEQNQLTFKIQNLKVLPVPISNITTDVLLTYTIFSYYPSGDITVFQQRCELLWVKERVQDNQGNPIDKYFIRVCHISNEYPYAKNDTIYPNNFNTLDIPEIYSGKKSNSSKLVLKGLYHSFFHLSGDTIVYMACNHGYTTIHTTTDVYESVEHLTDIVKKYPDTLMRIHASYAVNPRFVSEIGRFYVILEDGTKLNIPEKKYTRTRDELNRRMGVQGD